MIISMRKSKQIHSCLEHQSSLPPAVDFSEFKESFIASMIKKKSYIYTESSTEKKLIKSLQIHP